MHKFKEIFDRLKELELVNDTDKSFRYHDYMASLLSIYIDTNSLILNIYLHSKSNKIEINLSNMKQSLCINVFYLLGKSNLFFKFQPANVKLHKIKQKTITHP